MELITELQHGRLRATPLVTSDASSSSMLRKWPHPKANFTNSLCGRPHYNHWLPPDAQRERIQAVLVSPRNPLNIGAAARAMANFGFERLAVVAPYAPNWREARSAVGAPELLHKAREFSTLAEAVEDCTLVAGTGTLAHRRPQQQVVSLLNFAPLVQAEIERGGRVALVFGPEKHGLTRDNLSHCHLLVEIPANPRQPSINLGQAVAICLYELASRTFGGEAQVQEAGVDRGTTTASSGSLDLLADLVGEVMTAAGYSPTAMQEANRHDVRLLLRRLALTEPDSRRILGLFRRVLRRLRH